MDLATIVGLIAAVAVILFAILIGSGIGIFVNIPGLFIVVGGTICVVLIRYPLSSVINSFVIAAQTAIFDKTESPRELVDLSVEISKKVNRDGLLALENFEIKNKFFDKGIRMLVDGMDKDYISKALVIEMKKSIKAHENGQTVFSSIADSAPAMGMIGTLVGLVQMLANLSDPASIGPAMAVALLTTLYGSVIAQVFGIPIADKLGAKGDLEKNMMNLISESVLSIQSGMTPSVLEQLLETFMPQNSGDAQASEPA